MRIVVVGTGTEIGKTHLGVALLTALLRQGAAACGLKPIESGTEGAPVGADAAALAAASSHPVHLPPPYVFPDPVSPHLAARRANLSIDLHRVRAWVDAHHAPFLLVETAGALLSPLGPGISPLGPTLTNLDLALHLTPTACLLVGVDRLGVLHDITACQLALRSRPSPPPVTVVLQAPSMPDQSTGTNAAELLLLGLARHAFTLPRADPTAPPCQDVARAILRSLAQSATASAAEPEESALSNQR